MALLEFYSEGPSSDAKDAGVVIGAIIGICIAFIVVSGLIIFGVIKLCTCCSRGTPAVILTHVKVHSPPNNEFVNMHGPVSLPVNPASTDSRGHKESHVENNTGLCII